MTLKLGILSKSFKGFAMRDYNIILSYKKEVNMMSKVVKSKKIYSRKVKHKKAYYEKKSVC